MKKLIKIENDRTLNALMLRMSILLLLAIVFHIGNVPGWVIISSFLSLGVMVVPILFGKRLVINRFLIEFLAALFFAYLCLNYSKIGILETSVSNLILMSCLKIHNPCTKRNNMSTIFVVMFLILTHFLFSQEMWKAAYLMMCSVLTVSLLIDVNLEKTLPFKYSILKSSKMVLLSIPLMAVVFVIFPRFQGPIISFNLKQSASKTGLSDNMSPGDISSLVSSSDLAFRVNFEGNQPPKSKMYWRGPVFGYFDGRSWNGYVKPPAVKNRNVSTSDPYYNYTVTLEPTNSRWMMSMDVPIPKELPFRSSVNGDFQLMHENQIQDKMLYKMTSSTNYIMDADITEEEKIFYLALPKGINKKSAKMIEKINSEEMGAEEKIKNIINFYKSNGFSYTLKPPPLGTNSVDDFLFDTRAGFCEHFASSFAILARMSDIPSRIVTGYQGGEKSAIGDYWIVRQSEAHAWTELWIEGKGWVRFDPTAIIAPNRLEEDVANSLSNPEEQLDFKNSKKAPLFVIKIKNVAEWANNAWNNWFLGYDNKKQANIFKKAGINNKQELFSLLGLVIFGSMLIMTAVFLFKFKEKEKDLSVVQWNKLKRKLLKFDIVQKTGESSKMFIERIVSQIKHEKTIQELRDFENMYEMYRYSNQSDKNKLLLQMSKILNTLTLNKKMFENK